MVSFSEFPTYAYVSCDDLPLTYWTRLFNNDESRPSCRSWCVKPWNVAAWRVITQPVETSVSIKIEVYLLYQMPVRRTTEERGGNVCGGDGALRATHAGGARCTSKPFVLFVIIKWRKHRCRVSQQWRGSALQKSSRFITFVSGLTRPGYCTLTTLAHWHVLSVLRLKHANWHGDQLMCDARVVGQCPTFDDKVM